MSASSENELPLSQADWDIFNADVDAFFDLAFERERSGTMTIEQIGDLFPSELTDWQREDIEIAEAYREADERFFAAEDEHWLAIEERLARRDERRSRRHQRR